MIFDLEIKNEEISIRHCYGYGSEIDIPESIAGYPVTELSPYAFSDQKNKRLTPQGINPGINILWNEDTGSELSDRLPPDDIPPAHGGGVTCINLPPSLKKIGAYAFYNCTGLCRLSFFGDLKDLGAGLFSGCRSVKELKVCLGKTQTSCLKEMLQELHQELTVYMEGSIKARLVFPAYYEEIVENTPARVFSTQMHGSGRGYRSSFDARKFDFNSYDNCFSSARRAESFDTLLKITLGRLLLPAGLSSKHRDDYETWLCDHIEDAVRIVITERDMDALNMLVHNEHTTVTHLESAAQLAAGLGFPEATALIMDVIKEKDPGRHRKSAAARRFML